MKLTKADLISELSKASGEPVGAVERVLSAYGALALDELRNGIDVPLPGVGTFKAKDRAARQGRNPRTGEPAQIPARRVIAFTPGAAAKGRVDA